MTGTVLLTVAALAAQADGDPRSVRPSATSPFLQALTSGDSGVIRGQSPAFTGPVLGTPQPVTTYYQTPTYAPGGTPYYSDPTFGGTTPGMGVAPYTSDPWLNGGVAPYNASPSPYGVSPYGLGGNPGGAGGYSFGLNGPQPYRFGWTDRHDIAFIHDAGTNLGLGGDFGVDEFNFEKELTLPMTYNWVFSIAPQYNLRLYDGPFARRVALGDPFPAPGGTLPAASELPGNVHRLGLGLKLQTPTIGGIWTLEGGFNPALATDFGSSLDSDAVLYDGHLVLFGRLTPQFMVAVGAAYWDRVDDIVIPYAGVVWTPSDYLEFRLLFPKPRISLFLGAPFGLPTWAYVQGEYHVEAYQVGINGPWAIDTSMGGLVTPGEFRAVGSTRVQLEDWRVVGGLYTEGPFWTAFIEAGVVLDRTVSYSGPVTGFDVNDAFIFRMGVRY